MMEPNPSGLCQCGCGERTNLNRQTVTALGLVRGRPCRFVMGHSGRGRKSWNRKSPVEYIEQDCGYETPCWVWQLHRDRKGYAVYNSKSRPARAARLYYERKHGPMPDGMEPDHLCRNRACVNPDHLEAVTRAENVRRGDSTKLTAAQAQEIRGSSEPGVALAARFGISQQQVCNIRKGRCWVAA